MKTRNKIQRSVRAISPVIAVLLMIVIAVAAALVAYAWIMGYLSFTTAKAGKAIQIQSIARAVDNTLTVYVQNVGDSQVELSDIYVDDTRDPTASAALAGTKLDEGNTHTITSNGIYTGANQVKVKVVTADGTFTELKKTFMSGASNGGPPPVSYTLTVTIDPIGTGSVNRNNNGPYSYGDIVELTASPVNGYSFGGWSGDIITSVNPTTITIDGNKAVTAHFNENQQQLVIDSNFDNPQDWDESWDDWGNPPWHVAPGEGYGGTAAAKSNPTDDGPFTCDHLDASQATVIHITFKYKVYQTEANDLRVFYSYIQNPDSGSYSDDFYLLPNGNIGDPTQVSGAISLGDGWYQLTYTITKTSTPEAFTSYFRFRFESHLSSGGGISEQVWVDDVSIELEL